MILEIRYVNLQTKQYNSVYISFPSRYDGCLDLVVNRISKKVYRRQMLDAFNKRLWYGCYSAFTKDFVEFLKNKFAISEHNWCKYLFYGIKPYEEPIVVPFLSR